MNYEQWLNQMHVDPNDSNSPLLKWFYAHEPVKEKQKIIAASGSNTYAFVSTPLPAGFIRQPANPEQGVNFFEKIIITLYQRGVGNISEIQNDSQIYKLWRQMIIEAGAIDGIGRNVSELYNYAAVPSSCRQPDVDPDGKGVYAQVVHQFKYRIAAFS